MTTYQLNDLLVVIGQQTVDLALARGQIAQLEQRVRELESESTNSHVELVGVEEMRADAG